MLDSACLSNGHAGDVDDVISALATLSCALQQVIFTSEMVWSVEIILS